MLIGYARVSTQDQKLHLQKDALKQGELLLLLQVEAGPGAGRP